MSQAKKDNKCFLCKQPSYGRMCRDCYSGKKARKRAVRIVEGRDKQ